LVRVRDITVWILVKDVAVAIIIPALGSIELEMANLIAKPFNVIGMAIRVVCDNAIAIIILALECIVKTSIACSIAK
jgi:hypothetical protein